MFRHLRLRRPFAIFDAEATGLDPRSDRIVAIAVLRVAPDAEVIRYHRLIHPGIPIPEGATAVHGITDADVADQPPFPAIAPALARLLDGCDLGGFNLVRFDLPLLGAEFARVGRPLPLHDRAIIDVLRIYHTHEPRDLTAAVRFYLDRDHAAAHDAWADALATAEVLDAQLARYAELPRSIDELHARLTEVDIGGRFRRQAGRIVFAFGKHAGRPLEQVARRDPDYLRWMLAQDFLDDAKTLAERALAGAEMDRES
jgi:DNA polymerase-3 subunit epsilon